MVSRAKLRRPSSLALYERGLAAFGPFARVMLRQRAASGKEDLARLPERRGFAGYARPDGPLVWLHAATSQQFEALLPLTERIAGLGFWALVTTGPASAEDISQSRMPDGSIHQFAPLDVPAYVERFVSHWRPNLALISESAVQPNLIATAKAHGAPVVLIDAWMSERAYGRWRRARRTVTSLLGGFDLCLARSDADAARFAALGARRTFATGPLSVDADAPPADPTALAALTRATRGRPIMVAAAACRGEDMSLARAHAIARAHAPDVLTILTPGRATDGPAAQEAASLQGLVASRGDAGAEIDRSTEFYIADASAELGLFYRIADIVFMGGSLASEPGENPIEPARLGAPIVHGPHHGAFGEIYETLDQARGAIEVGDADALSAETARLLSDSTARQAMARAAALASARLGGALDRTVAAIEPYLMQIRLGAG